VTNKAIRKIANIISLCQQIKIDIVRKDPFDRIGLREKLNLGHTVGHALEGLGKGSFTHGECVAVGIVAAAKISRWKGLLMEKTCQLIIDTIQRLGLPTKVCKEDGPLKRSVLNQALNMDKKGGTFVLIRDIGVLETGVIVEKNIIDKVLSEVLI
jgi:3-dehydroquinate synthase